MVDKRHTNLVSQSTYASDARGVVRKTKPECKSPKAEMEYWHMILFFGFATGIGLSITVLFAMFLHGAAKVDEALDPESALVWQEAESKSLKPWSDVHQNERGSSVEHAQSSGH
jgi:hypothetical protein